MGINLSVLKDASGALGLQPEDAAMLRDALEEYSRHYFGNKTRLKYYEDKIELKRRTDYVTNRAIRNCSTGWGAKCVDMMAARSVWDGWTFTQADDEEAAPDMNEIMGEGFEYTYNAALPLTLALGFGCFTVSPGGEHEPPAVVNFHDALSSGAIVDYRKKRIKAGFVIEDIEHNTITDDDTPIRLVMHTNTHVITLTRDNAEIWRAEYLSHGMGRPLMEPIGYRPDLTRRVFGKPRITPAIMGIIDEMMAEKDRTADMAEAYSAPDKYLLGLPADQFEDFLAKKADIHGSKMLLTTKDEDGDTPQYGQLPQVSFTPHVEYMNDLRNQIASESLIPAAAFGINSTVYQSNDNMAASNTNLIVEVKSLNKTMGESLAAVALLAIATAKGYDTLDDLTATERSISVHWLDPSMPSITQTADAMVKVTSAPGASWIASTDVYLERNGFNAEERARMYADKRRLEARGLIDELLEANA